MLEFIRDKAEKVSHTLSKRSTLDATINVLTYAGLAGTALTIIAGGDKSFVVKGKNLMTALNCVKELTRVIRS